MHWEGSGIWQGWKLTTEHSASSYNQPVLVNPSGVVAGPGDIIVGPLIGVQEAALILGWDKRKIATYMSRGNFPTPIQRLASGSIWTKQQILDYQSSIQSKEEVK